MVTIILFIVFLLIIAAFKYNVVMGIFILFGIISLIVVFVIVFNKEDDANKKRINTNKNILQDVFNKYGLSDNSVTLVYGTSNFIFDYENKRFWYTNTENAYWEFHIFDSILKCETRINGSVSHSTTKGGLGSAIVGGIVAGGVGAVVGGVVGKKKTETIMENSSCQILIYFKSEKNPLFSLEFKDKSGIDFCDKLYARLYAIINN